MSKYTADDMTLMGYDRDNDKVWQATDGLVFVTFSDEGADAAVQQYERLNSGWELGLKAYADRFGPITEGPK